MSSDVSQPVGRLPLDAYEQAVKESKQETIALCFQICWQFEVCEVCQVGRNFSA